jgi:hypothetical protein
MSLSGDPKQLKALAKAIKKVVKKVDVETAKRSAPTLSGLLQGSFSAGEMAVGGSRPAGKKGPVDLVVSGALQSALNFRRRGNTAFVRLPSYARYNFRFGILPPSGQKPDSWMAAIRAMAVEALNEVFGDAV